MICIPQDYDQPMNAQIVSDQKCGVVFDDSCKEKISEKIEERVKTILNDFGSYRENVLKQQKQFMEADTVDMVVEKFEKSFAENKEDFKCMYHEFVEKYPGNEEGFDYNSSGGVFGCFGIWGLLVLVFCVIFGLFFWMR